MAPHGRTGGAAVGAEAAAAAAAAVMEVTGEDTAVAAAVVAATVVAAGEVLRQADAGEETGASRPRHQLGRTAAVAAAAAAVMVVHPHLLPGAAEAGQTGVTFTMPVPAGVLTSTLSPAQRSSPLAGAVVLLQVEGHPRSLSLMTGASGRE